MPTHVYANNNEVASKAADGKSIAAFPDVCFSPPAPPVGPMPLPYPNTGEVKDTDSGTAKVFVKDKMSGMAGDSYMTKSMGDEAATQNFNKGMITSALQGKCYFGLWSMDVQMEGKGVPRHLDLVTHNHGSVPGNKDGKCVICGHAGESKVCRDCMDKYYFFELHFTNHEGYDIKYMMLDPDSFTLLRCKLTTSEFYQNENNLNAYMLEKMSAPNKSVAPKIDPSPLRDRRLIMPPSHVADAVSRKQFPEKHLPVINDTIDMHVYQNYEGIGRTTVKILDKNGKLLATADISTANPVVFLSETPSISLYFDKNALKAAAAPYRCENINKGTEKYTTVNVSHNEYKMKNISFGDTPAGSTIKYKKFLVKLLPAKTVYSIENIKSFDFNYIFAEGYGATASSVIHSENEIQGHSLLICPSVVSRADIIDDFKIQYRLFRNNNIISHGEVIKQSHDDKTKTRIPLPIVFDEEKVELEIFTFLQVGDAAGVDNCTGSAKKIITHYLGQGDCTKTTYIKRDQILTVRKTIGGQPKMETVKAIR